MKIDINCDLGEGMTNDAEIMPYLGSCNIACGGHYGNKASMTETILLAKKYGVKIGAHPSFPDKENFGRKIIQMATDELQVSLYQQIQVFLQVCDELNVKMHHIKLHGALYNLAAADVEIAGMVLNVFAAAQTDIKIYVPYNSVIAAMAHDYFPICYEAFIDRRYHNDLTLVARTQDNALITNNKEAWQQMLDIINNGELKSVEGDYVAIKADTFCLHGDHENALSLIKYIHKCLVQ